MAGVRLRTKFQIAMLLVSAGLTAMTLVVVQRTVQTRVRQELVGDLQNSLATSRTVQSERESNLRATARLMADLPILKALMTSQHAPTIQDASQKLFELSGGDLLALMDASGQLVGLHSTGESTPRSAIENILRTNRPSGNTTEWWYAGGRLYEVRLEPIHFGPDNSESLLGVLAIGSQVNGGFPGRVRKIGASEVAVFFGGQLVASSLRPEQATELPKQKLPTGDAAAPVDVTLGSEKFVASAIVLNPDPAVLMVVMKSYDDAIAFLGRLQSVLLAIGGIAVLAGALIVALLARTFTRPLEKLAEGVSALGSGDFAFPLSSGGGGEVLELTQAFTDMRNRLLEAQQKLVESERLATIGRMAGSISHDLRHPLTAVLANAEFLADPALLASQREELYVEIRIAVNRLTDLIDSLLELSRPAMALALTDGPLLPTIHRAVDLIRTHPQFHKIRIDVEPMEVQALMEPRKLERAFYNLLLNGCQAVDPEAGMIEINLRAHPDYAELRVRDNGTGVPDAIRARLFEPFVSMGKQNGTGLGLTIAHKIILDHGGSLQLENSEPGSTVFLIVLPGPSNVAVKRSAAGQSNDRS